nr:hypothetical protein [Tanacetum cinerariifolium]
MQNQTSNTLHNAIMEAGGKDRPPMLAPGNYVQWKSRIKRYIDTKPNHEHIHYCLKNPPYKFTWEYYACAMGEAAPKPKASARKKKGDSTSFTTPPTPTTTTTVESAPWLSATAKGKQPSRATTPIEPTDVQRTEAEQLKIVLKRSRQETHISQQSGSSTDEGTGSKPGVPDVPSDNSKEELSWKSSNDEDVGGHEESNKSDESEDDHDEGSDDDSEETVKAGAENRLTRMMMMMILPMNNLIDVMMWSMRQRWKLIVKKAKGDLISYKMESQKSFNTYTQQINDLNQTISKMKKELCAHQETISILSQAKEAQIKLYKTHEDKELDKVVALENKVK